MGLDNNNAHPALKGVVAMVLVKIFKHKTGETYSGSDIDESLDAFAKDKVCWRPDCFGDQLV